jgi:hypothetical protein
LVDNNEERLTLDIVEDGPIDGEVFEYSCFDDDGPICMDLMDAINKAVTGKGDGQEYFKSPNVMFEDLDLDELFAP